MFALNHSAPILHRRFGFTCARWYLVSQVSCQCHTASRAAMSRMLCTPPASSSLIRTSCTDGLAPLINVVDADASPSRHVHRQLTLTPTRPSCSPAPSSPSATCTPSTLPPQTAVGVCCPMPPSVAVDARGLCPGPAQRPSSACARSDRPSTGASRRLTYRRVEPYFVPRIAKSVWRVRVHSTQLSVHVHPRHVQCLDPSAFKHAVSRAISLK